MDITVLRGGRRRAGPGQGSAGVVRRLALAAIALTAVACSPADPVGEYARQACAAGPSSFDAASYRDLGGLRVSLPAGLEAVALREAWADGGVEFSGLASRLLIINGAWTEANHVALVIASRRCRVEVAGLPVLVNADERGGKVTVSALILTAGNDAGPRTLQPLMSIELERAQDLEAFRHLLWSARRGSADVVRLAP